MIIDNDAPQTPPAPMEPTPSPTPVPVGPNKCHWLWSGTKWVEDPSLPCECTELETCDPPTEPGAYIDQEAITPCK